MIKCYEDYVKTVQAINSGQEYIGGAKEAKAELDGFIHNDHATYQKYLKRMQKEFNQRFVKGDTNT